MESIEAVPDVPYKDNPDFDPDVYFENIIGVTRWGHPIRIKFWASKEQAKYIATKPIHSSQKIISTNPEDGSMIFMLFVEPNWEFFSTMLGFGPGIYIISPKSVVDEMKRKLAKAIDLYSANE